MSCNPHVQIVAHPDIERSLVTRIYRGKIGCCCGCLGTYRDNDQKNRLAVTRMLNEIERAPRVERGDCFDGEVWYGLDDRENNRRILVFVKEVF